MVLAQGLSWGCSQDVGWTEESASNIGTLLTRMDVGRRPQFLTSWVSPQSYVCVLMTWLPQNKWSKRDNWEKTTTPFMSSSQKSQTIALPHPIHWKWVTKSSPHSMWGELVSTFWEKNYQRIWEHIIKTITELPYREKQKWVNERGLLGIPVYDPFLQLAAPMSLSFVKHHCILKNIFFFILHWVCLITFQLIES